VPFTVRLDRGDSLLVYSDGLTDQRVERERFGEKALIDALADALDVGTEALPTLRRSLDRFLNGRDLIDDLLAAEITSIRESRTADVEPARLAA